MVVNILILSKVFINNYKIYAEKFQIEQQDFYASARKQSIISSKSVIVKSEEIERYTGIMKNIRRIKALTIKNLFVMWQNIL